MKTLGQRIVEGAAAGLLSTAVMSVAFLAAQRAGTIGKLPPRLIVQRFLPKLSDRQLKLVAAVAHLAYGMAAGSLFAALRARKRLGLPYALAVWAASYEGWVPAARILPAAHRDERSRALTILGAHVVYGLALAATGTLRPRGPRVNP